MRNTWATWHLQLLPTLKIFSLKFGIYAFVPAAILLLIFWLYFRYGFVTFETQEDAEKIISKESQNLIFKDRKLNIGPAVRKQVTCKDNSMLRTLYQLFLNNWRIILWLE